MQRSSEKDEIKGGCDQVESPTGSKSLALAIKSSQNRNQEFARHAQHVIKSTRKRLEESTDDHKSRTYSAKGKMNIKVPRGRRYGKG